MTAPLPTGADGQPVQMDNVPFTALPAPAFPRPVAVALPSLDLSEVEAELVARLVSEVTSQRFTLELHDAYYRGQAKIADLGISIPPQMRALHVALGWPRVTVDALDERLDIEGFRYPGSPDVDTDLQEIWLANGMESESQIANLDALVFGRGFVSVGAGEDFPLIAVESPLDFAVDWDARTRTVVNALRLFDRGRQATLYTQTETLSLELGTGWRVVERDRHNLGVCPVVRIANRPRSYSRDGGSEITTEIMSITDSACRTLLGLEVAREFYSAPQRYILGASESAFQDAAGQPKSAWETYIGRVLALERDEEGNLPTVGQFAAYDPASFTTVIDMYAKIISSITGLPPHVLGYTTDNPASADAIRSSEMRHTRKADRKTKMFGAPPWRDVARLTLAVRDGKALDPATARIVTVWASTATPTPAATTDSLSKQIAAGMIPATSTVTLEEAGYSATQIQRLEADRKADAGTQFLAEVAKSVIGKEAKTAAGLGSAAEATQPPVPGAPAGS